MTTTKQLLVEYVNGDYTVQIYEDGTKIRSTDVENPQFVHPESIDVKITNYCDMGCKYCHEMSTEDGKHGDLDVLREVLRELPKGVELAIGGGNPLAHPDLEGFLLDMKHKGFICNLTVNQGHLGRYMDMLKKFIENDIVKGIGVSITSNNFKYVQELMDLTDNVVLHMIAGVNDIDMLDTFLTWNKPIKVLVLGYKNFGFGVTFNSHAVKDGIERWTMLISNYFGKMTLAFDNLALEQLEIKRFFELPDGQVLDGWKQCYMGDDFTHSMYIDAIEQEYAPTSRSLDRVSFVDDSLVDYFNANKMR